MSLGRQPEAQAPAGGGADAARGGTCHRIGWQASPIRVGVRSTHDDKRQDDDSGRAHASPSRSPTTRRQRRRRLPARAPRRPTGRQAPPADEDRQVRAPRPDGRLRSRYVVQLPMIRTMFGVGLVHPHFLRTRELRAPQVRRDGNSQTWEVRGARAVPRETTAGGAIGKTKRRTMIEEFIAAYPVRIVCSDAGNPTSRRTLPLQRPGKMIRKSGEQTHRQEGKPKAIVGRKKRHKPDGLQRSSGCSADMAAARETWRNGARPALRRG